MPGLAQEDERARRSDFEISEDEKKRIRIRSLKKKAMNASTKISHTLRRRSSRVAHCRYASISIDDYRDEKEEESVNAFRQLLIQKDLLPPRHDDYHTLLRRRQCIMAKFSKWFSMWWELGMSKSKEVFHPPLVKGIFDRDRRFKVEISESVEAQVALIFGNVTAAYGLYLALSSKEKADLERKIEQQEGILKDIRTRL